MPSLVLPYPCQAIMLHDVVTSRIRALYRVGIGSTFMDPIIVTNESTLENPHITKVPSAMTEVV